MPSDERQGALEGHVLSTHMRSVLDELRSETAQAFLLSIEDVRVSQKEADDAER